MKTAHVSVSASAAMETVRVYAGRHYGREHLITVRDGNTLTCLHPGSGDTVVAHQCDVECHTTPA